MVSIGCIYSNINGKNRGVIGNDSYDRNLSYHNNGLFDIVTCTDTRMSVQTAKVQIVSVETVYCGTN